MRKFDLLLLSLGLLAVAFPPLVLPVLGTAATVLGEALAVVAWALTHLSLTCATAAAVVLAHAFPAAFTRTTKRLVRALAASAVVVLPRTA